MGRETGNGIRETGRQGDVAALRETANRNVDEASVVTVSCFLFPIQWGYVVQQGLLFAPCRRDFGVSAQTSASSVESSNAHAEPVVEGVNGTQGVPAMFVSVRVHKGKLAISAPRPEGTRAHTAPIYADRVPSGRGAVAQLVATGEVLAEMIELWSGY